MKELDIFGTTEQAKLASKILLVLDYDGTLMELQQNPEDAVSTKELKEMLFSINKNQRIDMLINTGRQARSIENMLQDDSLDIAAEHGAMFKSKGEWIRLLEDDSSWKDKFMPYFKETTLKCRHSFLEEKPCSISWHYRKSDSEEGSVYSRQLLRTLEELAVGEGVRILDGNKIVEVSSQKVNKGTAIQYVLKDRSYDLVIAMGDDVTDEDMFDVLTADHHLTVKIGEGVSRARYYLRSVADVHMFLKELNQ